MRAAGKYSYGIYVFHPLWIDALRAPGALAGLGSFAPAGRFVAITTLSVASAWLSWHLYEKHFLRLKARFAYEAPEAAPASPLPARPARLGPTGQRAIGDVS